MFFSIIHKDGKARVGVLKTRHGNVETPYFVAVATQAVGKFVGPDDYSLVTDGLICNALILSLRPGTRAIKNFGSIHKFMNYDKTIFTDCGGFQMLRDGFMDDRSKKGIFFKSPFDGKKFLLTPEKIMAIEQDIGADAVMMLDDVAPYGSSMDDFERSLENTSRWAVESKHFHTDDKQMLYGIVQGGFFADLRKKAAININSLDFDGIAIGGVAIGETRDEMYVAIRNALPYLNEDKPKHLLGVGSPDDIVESIAMGLDTFDSVFPTQNARHGSMFTFNGKLDVLKSEFSDDKTPIEKGCKCLTCRNYSKAYIRHLLKMNDPSGKRYATVHNLYFMKELMRQARLHIKNKTFDAFRKKIVKAYKRNTDPKANVGVNVAKIS